MIYSLYFFFYLNQKKKKRERERCFKNASGLPSCTHPPSLGRLPPSPGCAHTARSHPLGCQTPPGTQPGAGTAPAPPAAPSAADRSLPRFQMVSFYLVLWRLGVFLHPRGWRRGRGGSALLLLLHALCQGPGASLQIPALISAFLLVETMKIIPSLPQTSSSLFKCGDFSCICRKRPCWEL